VLAALVLVSLAMPTTGYSQQARQTDLERYQAAVRNCENGHRSRAASRNYRNGTTRAEVDAMLKKCLDTERARYERILARRARGAAN
jgi:hypothetical protein